MSQRQRMTWGGEARRASAHPATPDEGPASPAHKPDPGQDDYKNGDTSSWAEDVHGGPYPNSAHPATPDEGPAHPAFKSAAEQRMLEKRASLCIRIATAMLGDPEGDPAKVAAVEDQALSLMDLSDSAIKASLKRLGQEEEEEVEEEDEEEVEEAKSKKASRRLASLEDRIARIERVLVRLAEEEEVEEEEVEEAKSKKAGEEEAAEGEEEASEGEEAKKKAGMYMGEEEAMLQQMLEEEGMAGAPGDEEACGGPAPMSMGDDEFEMGMDDMDPMGMGEMPMDDDEQMILASLFGKNAGEEEEVEEEEVEEAKSKKAGEEEEVEEEVEEAKSKKAAARPQPKKASVGAKKLGGIAKEAGSDVDDLSKLWESAPDVSRIFG